MPRRARRCGRRCSLNCSQWWPASSRRLRRGGLPGPPGRRIDARVLEDLPHGGHRDAEFADSVAVAGFYKHLHDWLNGPGHGAQILVVDNAPPPSADDDVVVRFSRRADQPPYGLIDDEVS